MGKTQLSNITGKQERREVNRKTPKILDEWKSWNSRVSRLEIISLS